ncbi:dodecin family protein [Novilysobacter defluvii]|uniref:Dodecin domain-containing protein n=1 Tax=Lysobacter defluvii IMMIB APB-9 = DSM 18482 TaxID=1385515 RepID=A0A0A0M7D7_9GAMM|nr:dodecin family protein [Lysobacter defluvii]KGO97932.1 hypothetical protein N791_03505 [Lysobacter defluvii IMMIB APB-9 = DSM 18482]
MAVAKVIEIYSSSDKSVEDAVRQGLKKASESIKNIRGAWIKETKVQVDGDGNITEWRVDMKVTFVVD